MARKKRTPGLTDNLEGADRYEADKLLALETIDRDIAATEIAKKESVDRFNATLKELATARNTVLDDLISFRLGERKLPLEGNIGDPSPAGKAEPGVDG